MVQNRTSHVMMIANGHSQYAEPRLRMTYATATTRNPQSRPGPSVIASNGCS